MLNTRSPSTISIILINLSSRSQSDPPPLQILAIKFTLDKVKHSAKSACEVNEGDGASSLSLVCCSSWGRDRRKAGKTKLGSGTPADFSANIRNGTLVMFLRQNGFFCIMYFWHTINLVKETGKFTGELSSFSIYYLVRFPSPLVWVRELDCILPNIL